VTHPLHGVFPFGQPSGRCQPRRVDDADAVVLGVYPSALHIRWTGPRQRISALAVAEEPWPFWTGEDEAERVSRWREAVGWSPDFGTAEPAGRLNGSSGRAVRDAVLAPWGLTPDRIWSTDALPFFHVHRGQGTQGEAMSGRYDTFARTHGLPVHRLPDRPPTHQLIRRAVSEEGERLLEELQTSRAALLITLGNEALAVAAQLLPGDLPDRLVAGESYGRRRSTTVQGGAIEILPLLHPGQRSAHWRQTHERWAESQTRL
jgi:uracil-DNA glycosylase